MERAAVMENIKCVAKAENTVNQLGDDCTQIVKMRKKNSIFLLKGRIQRAALKSLKLHVE